MPGDQWPRDTGKGQGRPTAQPGRAQGSPGKVQESLLEIHFQKPKRIDVVNTTPSEWRELMINKYPELPHQSPTIFFYFCKDNRVTSWFLSFQRIERAFRLALRLGKDNDLLASVVNHMENLLEKYKTEDQIFFSTKLMRLLQEQHLGDFAKYAELSEKAAICEEKSRQWNRSREWWEMTSCWYSLLKNTEEERRIKVIIAETYINQANVAISNPSPSYRIATSCLEKAIKAYRQVGGMKGRVEQLHKLLLKYQPLAMSEMKVFTHEINVGPITEYVMAQMREKSFKDSILQLASMCASPSLENLKSEVEKGFRDYPLQFISEETLYNQSGKVVAHKSSIISSSPEENKTVFNEKVFQIHMVKLAIYRQQTYGSIIVDYARYQISLEHNVSIKDFDFIVIDNPLALLFLV